VVALLGMHTASSLHTLPDYLAYSNELFGGTSRTYRTLSDSNVDWGQGLREARQYLARRNIKECWLAYFGSADPAYYHLPCKMLPDPFLKWWGMPIPVPPEQYHGVVLIGGTEPSAPYWGSEELNPYSQFLHTSPTANIGGSLLVFEGEVDLRRPSAFGHMYKAWELIAAQQQEAAIQEILVAEDLLPDHPAPRYMLGYVLARAKRPEAARLQFEEAVRLARAAHPEFGALWLRAAQLELALLP
jgi:tetratricopeptide (TPR) repeat protein